MKWEKVKFADFIMLQRGYDLTRDQFKIGDYPVVSSTTIMGFHNEYKANAPGVIIGRSGTLGEVQFVNQNYWPHNTALYVKDFKGNIPRFVYYFLKNFGTEMAGGGSAVPTLNRNNLNILDIVIPDIETQRRIAGILSAYDDLIENNQRQIKLLEEAAQRLYKEWFVDFRFPGHETTPITNGIPEGWEKGAANDFFEITIGKTPPRAEKEWFTTQKNGVPWVSIADMGNSGVFICETAEGLTSAAMERHNVKYVPTGSVLLSFKLTVGRVAIAALEMCTNEAIAHFRIEDETSRAYTYFYLKNYHYVSLGSTSAISQAINSKIVKSMPFIMPSSEIRIDFSKKVNPILDQIKVKQSAIMALREARDRLLPKLMSGEIDVSEVEV